MVESSSGAASGEPVLGVIGGMGPEATVRFLDEVIAATPVQRDRDHIETVVYNDPNVPDRNNGILGEGEDPLPRLQRNAMKLEEFGADVLAIPCNTAHYLYDDVAAAVDADIIDMIAAVRTRLEQMSVYEVGLLATSTVMDVGVYRDEFEDSSIELVHPRQTDVLMDAIYAIKRGDKEEGRRKVNDVVTEFPEVDAVITACTELSVIRVQTDVDLVDPTTILAERCVETVLENRD